MKAFIQRLIQSRARVILAKYRPTIVAVTGSVGKTSARNAIAAVLGERFRVRVPPGNYNNEFGVPLTVIGAASPGRSVSGWLAVLWKAQRLLWHRDASYPNLLALEYGADRPGDIANLCRFARPDVAVWTSVSPVHVANYPSFDRLIEEKAEIVRHVNSHGLSVLNADDAQVMARKDRSTAPVLTYGFAPGADVRAEQYRLALREDASYQPGERFAALEFELVYRGERASVAVPNLVGRAQVSAALAAAAVGIHFGLPLQEIAARLAEMKSEPGRLRPLPGVKGCLILDDSYNAAPASVAAGIDTLAKWPLTELGRRIAVLGSMAELGRHAEQEHRMIGMQAAVAADMLVTVGEPARDYARGAKEAGMDEAHVVELKDSVEAGRWLDAHVRSGDVVFVKGSQSARMEKSVKDILAEPDRAAELLCRQYGKWLEE